MYVGIRNYNRFGYWHICVFEKSLVYIIIYYICDVIVAVTGSVLLDTSSQVAFSAIYTGYIIYMLFDDGRRYGRHVFHFEENITGISFHEYFSTVLVYL